MAERQDQDRRGKRQKQVEQLKTELESPGTTTLVVTRELGQSVVIGGGITVTVNKITRSRVMLGITAPKETSIFREELLKENQPEQNSEPPAQ